MLENYIGSVQQCTIIQRDIAINYRRNVSDVKFERPRELRLQQ